MNKPIIKTLLQRNINTLLILIFITTKSFAVVYTFESQGNYTDADNWDIYPGTELVSNDTISIEANCLNIELYGYNGYIVFSENVFEISIADMSISDECQVEFLANYFQMTISGYFFYMTNNQILTPYISTIIIYNFGYGIEFNTCPIWTNSVNIEYYNEGVQNAFLVECMEGEFYNYGTIEVFWSIFNLNFNLYLENGTIEGIDPFTIYQYNGSFNQSCSTCTATINNIENLQLNGNNTIDGTVILNAPD